MSPKRTLFRTKKTKVEKISATILCVITVFVFQILIGLFFSLNFSLPPFLSITFFPSCFLTFNIISCWRRTYLTHQKQEIDDSLICFPLFQTCLSLTQLAVIHITSSGILVFAQMCIFLIQNEYEHYIDNLQIMTSAPFSSSSVGSSSLAGST